MTSPLHKPYTFKNGAVAKNRAWLAPMTNTQSQPTGELGEDELAWIARRAKGGFAVVETCAAHVTEDGKAWDGQLGISRDDLLPGLARLATAIREEGALGLMQLFHGGLRADPKLTGGRIWSASAVETKGLATPEAATAQDIEAVIAAFKDAAVRAHNAGFAGVELHGAHGYLLGQFLSSVQNQRTDAWGGSFENRSRLIRETMRAVRSAVPSSFLVGVRLSPEDFGQAIGIDLDESITLARDLVNDGADFIHASLWKAENPTKKRPSEHPIPLFRAALPKDVPLVIAGAIWTKEEAESFLAMGADLIAVGRCAILNPSWPDDIVKPDFTPRRAPMTRAELREIAVSERFAQYLKRFNLVAD